MATSKRHVERSAVAAATPAAAPTTDLAEAVTLGARRVAAAITDPGDRSRDQWLGVVGDCQLLINTVAAVQDRAIAEAARRESVWCEDGTLGESVHSPGRVTLDAADVVAPLIGATHQQAQRRVEQAVRLAAHRVPVPAEQPDLPQPSGLGGLHQAMAAGQLDGYRAGVVAFELEVAPADVADAVVAALSGHLGEDSSSLRKRTRVLLSRISPDLVRERAQRARANTGLRRWVAEPGVDEWHGTFPSEDAATAWAAIDRLAHDLVAAGTCTNIEQARGKALTDLVTGNATIDVQIVLTVPADTQPGPHTPHTPAPTEVAAEPHVSGTAQPASGEPPFDTAALTDAAAGVVRNDQGALDGDPLDPRNLGPDRPVGGAATAQHTSATDPQGPAAPAVRTEDLAAVNAEPQQTSATDLQELSAPTERTDDLAEVHGAPPPTRPTVADVPAHAPPAHPPAATGSDGSPTHSSPPHPTKSGSDDDLIEVQGSRPSEPLLVRRGWLRDHLGKQPPQSRGSTRKKGEPPPFVPCDPLTGARLDPRDDLATNAYRPSAQLTALVKARDGRCRFPGCCVAARFCDLDHVRPWPVGPTTATNLLTLCRRHHRIKQRPGWRLHLAPDGTTTWTDPTGRDRTTAPLDALRSLVLVPEPSEHSPSTPTARTAGNGTNAITTGAPGRTPAGPGSGTRAGSGMGTGTSTGVGTKADEAASSWSILETITELRLEHAEAALLDRCDVSRDRAHRRCTSAADLRAGYARRCALTPFPDEPPF